MSLLAETRTTQDGRRVRFLTGGAGPVLVLCHGFLGSAENFDAWIEALCSRRTLVIPDLPGCGESDPLPVEHSAANLATSVAALVDELGIERFDLGGLCLGAPVACALARRRPTAVRRLLLHTPLLAPHLVRRRFHLMTGVMTAPGVFTTVVRLSRVRRVSDIYKRLMVEGADVDPVAAGVNFDNQQRADPRAAREWLRDGLRCHDAELIGGLAVPVLLIAAAGDRVVNVERLRSMCGAWPMVSCTIDDDAGHAWSAESVARQLSAITGFLDADAPSAATSAA